MTSSERTILITGSTSGLGRALAHTLSSRPGRLILHGRSRDKLDSLREELAESEAAIDTVTADLAEQSQVRRLADEVAERTGQLGVLVNNAGIGKGRGDVREVSPDGIELRLAVNHLASFVLSLRLLPLLEAGAPARIVNVASGAQQPVDFDDLQLMRGYTGSRAYAQSKLAMITTGMQLAEKVSAEAVTVNSLHPATLMPTAMVEEGYGHTIDDLETGRAATMRLIESADLAGVTGRYFSRTEPADARDEAYDPDYRRRLWQLSEDLTNTSLS